MPSPKSPESLELKGPWVFQVDQDQRGEKEGWQEAAFDRRGWMPVKVPGAWDFFTPALRDYEGVAWYATTIPRKLLQPSLWQRLHFASVHHHAKAWVDGQLVAEHSGGYFPFEADLSPYWKGGAATLVLRVDNQAGYDRLPGSTTVEWVQYGGILQPVSLLSTPKLWISDLRVNAVPAGKGAQVTAQFEVRNESGMDYSGTVALKVQGSSSNAELHCPAGGRAALSLALAMPKAAAWSPESPVLHLAEVRLGRGLYAARQRFGVRKLEAKGRQLLLNGRAFKIKGVNRYDDFPDLGPRATEKMIRQDLLRIKKMGANLIRVHYPQSPLHHRLMDELGLLLMEEVPLNWWRAHWHAPVPAEYQNDKIIDAAERALEAMVRRDGGHPSLAIWSMCNESETSDALGNAAMLRLLKKARELDPGRLCTFVPVGEPKDHPALGQADIACGNMYYGLFHKDMAAHFAELSEKVQAPTLDYLRRCQAQAGDKPFLFTECGAQAIPGMRGDLRFSEDFQAAYLEAVWKAVEEAGIAGWIIWSWADYRHRRGFMGTGVGPMWAAPYGPFGVVGWDRKAKKAYATMKRLWKG